MVDETPAEAAKRRFKEAEGTQKRIDAMYDFALEPRDLYADAVAFNERDGVLRIGFHCSRPEAEDILGAPTVPVARIAIPVREFRRRFGEWLASEEGRAAVGDE